MNSKESPGIVILGGGTAGWITANLLHKHIKHADITLVASEDIGIIGVGEGSTPHLKHFFDELGISEAQWMPFCNATYKNGIHFKDWSTKPGFQNYFHPFASKIDGFSAPIFIHNSNMRRKGYNTHAHPDRYYLSAKLAQNKLSPINAENFPFDIGYGYHFDANKMAEFLQIHATNVGVKYINGKFAQANSHLSGDIQSVTLEDGRQLTADLFIDCTGFNGVLIEKILQTPFVSFKDNLFCNAAVALASSQNEVPASQTVARALSHGWAWEIPLINRIGNGYVYSNDYISADMAETELRTRLGLLDSDVTARHLTMRVGRRQEHWRKNVLAIGLSQGFIEPLEATAIHLTIETVKQFIGAWQNAGFTNQHQSAFNQLINQNFESVRDYIVTHYKLNSRNDSNFWRDNRNNQNLSPHLVSLLNCWLKGEDLDRHLAQNKIPGYYPPFSWHCILAGYGIFPEPEQLKEASAAMSKYDLVDNDEFIRRSSLNFQDHKTQLEQLKESV